MAGFEQKEYDHESYGTIGVSHISGRGEVLFGSSIRHSEIIRITVSKAKLYRQLKSDRIMGNDELVTVDLSYSQFTEFVTTHNRGTGIPCTIRRLNGEGMEDPPFFNKREQHAGEFRESTAKIGAKLDQVHAMAEALLEKPTATKKDRAELLEAIRYARQCVVSDLPFAVSQFDAQVEKSVTEAKGEIEGFALRRLLLAGQQAMESDEYTSPPPPQIEFNGPKDSV